MDHNKRHEELVLYATYNPDNYPKYDNYDAIEVSKVVEIPKIIKELWECQLVLWTNITLNNLKSLVYQ